MLHSRWFGGPIILTNGWWSTPQSPSVGQWSSALEGTGSAALPAQVRGGTRLRSSLEGGSQGCWEDRDHCPANGVRTRSGPFPTPRTLASSWVHCGPRAVFTQAGWGPRAGLFRAAMRTCSLRSDLPGLASRNSKTADPARQQEQPAHDYPRPPFLSNSFLWISRGLPGAERLT